MRSERETIPVTTPRRRPGRPRTKPDGPSKAQRNLMTTLSLELPLLLMQVDQLVRSPRPGCAPPPEIDFRSEATKAQATDTRHVIRRVSGY